MQNRKCSRESYLIMIMLRNQSKETFYLTENENKQGPTNLAIEKSTSCEGRD